MIDDPERLIDIVTNMVSITESNIIFQKALMDRSFLTKYLVGRKLSYTNEGSADSVVITGFDHLSAMTQDDDAATRDAFITIRRQALPDGVTSVAIKLQLYGRNSIGYADLQGVMKHRLQVRDPINVLDYFPKATTNPQGNHFYWAALSGSSGDRAALAMMGPFATLDLLSLTVDGARK